MFQLMRLLLIATILSFVYMGVIVTIYVPLLRFIFLIVIVALLCKKTYRYTAMGTARWANADDMPHMLQGDGLIVGHLDEKPSRRRGIEALFDPAIPAKKACQLFNMAFQKNPPKFLVRLTKAVHTAVFAPTGAGKGVSFVLPYLLTCRDSMVVIDFKGENALITARERHRMGQRIIILDPYQKVTSSPDCFNALDQIDRNSTTAIDECRDLAAAIVVRTGEEKEPHWLDTAETWITAMIAFVVCFAEPEKRNLQSVRILLTNPVKMKTAIDLMCKSEDIWQGMLSRLGYQLTHFKDEELASTLTTANRMTNFLDTIPVFESTQKSTFDTADLLNGKTTIYLILPPEHAKTQSSLLRLWISSMLRAVVKGGLQEKNKVQFLLDEAASLGHMEAIDNAVDQLRGYGVRLTFMFQSAGQLKKCFPAGQEQTFLSNVTQIFFGINELETANYVSSRLGEKTIIVNSGGEGTGWSRQSSQASGGGGSTGTSGNANHNWQQQARKLLKPEEVLGLSQNIAITFANGVPPMWTRLIRYYDFDFKKSQAIRPLRSLFQALGLFLSALFFAVLCTVAVIKEMEVDHVGRNEGFIRRDQEGQSPWTPRKDSGRGRENLGRGKASVRSR